MYSLVDFFLAPLEYSNYRQNRFQQKEIRHGDVNFALLYYHSIWKLNMQGYIEVFAWVGGVEEMSRDTSAF